MVEYSMFVPDVTFEKIPIKNLVSNQDYQRNLSISHIQKAAANFDLHQINPVKVSRRDGINYVFNGQHTIEIIALISGSRETPVWCMVYDDLNYEHEADIFAKQQKYVKPLLPYEIFMANVEAGNDDQLVIRDLVESYGLTISNKTGPSNICAVSTLESIYKKYGFQTLSRVLRLCIGAWEGDCKSFSANILNGITKLVVTYGEQLDDETFKNKVGALSIKQLTRNAKDRRPGSMGFAEAMVLEYNGRKKSKGLRLRFGKLYTKENALFKGLAENEDPDDISENDENDDDMMMDGYNEEAE